MDTAVLSYMHNQNPARDLESPIFVLNNNVLLTYTKAVLSPVLLSDLLRLGQGVLMIFELAFELNLTNFVI